MDEEHPILLVAAPWKDRAYLLAELQERGYEVRAFPSIVAAIGYLVRRPRVHPALVILDIGEDPDISSRTIEDLFSITEDAPWLVIASRVHPLPEVRVLHAPRVHIVYRPVRVGSIVAQAERLLQEFEAHFGKKGSTTQ